jgi:hypothetical protein
MTTHHSSAIGALDAFWAIIRRQAERDPAFAAEIAKALTVPIELTIETSADVQASMPLLDPIVIAGRGLDDFLSTFTPLKDADLKKIIKAYNLASSDAITGKTAPKGKALVHLMWEAAAAQRKRLQDRAQG